MCNFISAVAIREGEQIKVITSDHSDSHTDILESLGIQDTKEIPSFVNLELTPVGKISSASLQNVESWVEKVDQDIFPNWWTSTAREEAFAILRSKVKKMFITGEVDVIDKGRWILLEVAIIGEVRNAQIVYMLGNSRIKKLCGSSQVDRMYNSSKVCEMYDKSKICAMYGNSKVNVIRDSSQVGEMRDSSQVGEMRDSSKVDVMFNSTQVYVMFDSSQVNTMCDSNQVYVMRDSSQIVTMRDSSKVGGICDSSKVNEMCDNSEVTTMFDSSQVTTMCENSKVDRMYDSSKVGEMYESSKVGEMYGNAEVGEMNNDTVVYKTYNSSKVGVMHNKAKVLKNKKGMNMEGSKNTAYGAVNAIAEYADWSKGTRVTTGKDEFSAKTESVLWGSSSQLKQKGAELVEEYITHRVVTKEKSLVEDILGV